MAERFVHVKGLEALNEFMQQLPVKLERNVIRGALHAAGKPMQAAAKVNVPAGPPSAYGARTYKHYLGALRDSIRVVGMRNKVAGRVTAAVRAGGKLKSGADLFYAYWIEYTGAAPHLITPKKDRMGGASITRHTYQVLFFGGTFVHHVAHPGFHPKPFMRPAFDSAAGAAVVAAGEYIKKRLETKHGLDTSDIDIELEN